METPTLKIDYARAGYNTPDPDHPTADPNLYPPNRIAFDTGWKAGAVELARKTPRTGYHRWSTGSPDYG